jgi:hypothetical protein
MKTTARMDALGNARAREESKAARGTGEIEFPREERKFRKKN